jgi:hypothetical protein
MLSGGSGMTKRLVTTPDVLDGQVSLDLGCLDRIYLNGYVPNLQVGGQRSAVHVTGLALKFGQVDQTAHAEVGGVVDHASLRVQPLSGSCNRRSPTVGGPQP